MPVIKAKTNYGTVTGTDLGHCGVFKGVPFAKPPVGELRFKAPVEPDCWEGEKACTEFSPMCIQLQRGPGRPDAAPMNISEDCLYLNIWTPAESSEERLPVMFWIYGGGFTGGSASQPEFDGKYLAKYGVIVVTVNYRCGPFGFFALPEWGDRSGNLGILDEAAALKWVYENIAAFGGDKDRILVFGQSAGGVSTRMMLASPLTRNMVARAIPESGGGLNEADPVRPAEEYKQLCADTLKELGWTENDIMTRDPLEVCKGLSEAGGKVLARMESGRIVGVFQPYIDGYALPDVPGKMIAEGDYNTNAEVICFTVSGDDWMFSRKVQEILPEEFDAITPKTRPFSLVPQYAWGRHQIKTGGKEIRAAYLEKTRPEYAFGRMSRPGIVPHGSEIAYVFGTIVDKYSSLDEMDIKVRDAMMTYWTNFAKTGDPNLPAAENLPYWPVFSEDCQKAMHFDNEGIRMDDLMANETFIKICDYTEDHPGMLMNLDGFENY